SLTRALRRSTGCACAHGVRRPTEKRPLMPEWLRDTGVTTEEWSLALFIELTSRLTVAFALGCVVAGVYHLTQKRRDRATNLLPTLVLLTVLIAMVTLVIGNSVARAFSLVGALAIVRFR